MPELGTSASRRALPEGFASARFLSRAVIVLASIALLAQGPIDTADTSSYVNAANMRPPVYPIFLWITRLVAGGSFRVLAVLAQLAIATLACDYAVERLGRLFRAPPLASGLARLVLFLGAVHFGRDLSAETLSLSFLLFLVGSLPPLVESPSWKTLRLPALFLPLLILTRAQFLMFLPVLVAFAACLAIARNRRAAAHVAALLVIATLSSTLVPRLYNGLVNHTFRPVSATGLQLLTVVVYNSTDADVERLPTERERVFTRAVMASAHARRLLEIERPPGVPRFHHLGSGYNGICLQMIVGHYGSLFLGKTLEPSIDSATSRLTPEEWATMDAFQTKVALHLLRTTWRKFVVHVVASLIDVYKYFAVLAFAFTAFAILERPRESWLVLFVTLSWLANAVLVLMVEVPMGRYLFYFDALVVALVLLAFGARSESSSRETAPS